MLPLPHTNGSVLSLKQFPIISPFTELILRHGKLPASSPRIFSGKKKKRVTSLRLVWSCAQPGGESLPPSNLLLLLSVAWPLVFPAPSLRRTHSSMSLDPHVIGEQGTWGQQPRAPAVLKWKATERNARRTRSAGTWGSFRNILSFSCSSRRDLREELALSSLSKARRYTPI